MILELADTKEEPDFHSCRPVALARLTHLQLDRWGYPIGEEGTLAPKRQDGTTRDKRHRGKAWGIGRGDTIDPGEIDKYELTHRFSGNQKLRSIKKHSWLEIDASNRILSPSVEMEAGRTAVRRGG
jgi:hypothetical protein